MPPATAGEPLTRAEGHPVATLRGRWPLLARVAWVGFALLAAGLFAAGLLQRYDQLRACAFPDCSPELARTLAAAGLSLGAYAAYQLAVAAAFALACQALAALLVWRAPTSRMALFAAFVFTAFSPTFGGVLYELGQRPSALGTLARLLDDATVAFLVLLYLFPDGRFVPRWTRWPAALALGLALASALFPRSPIDMDTSPLGPVAVLALLVSAVAAQVYRYRRVSDAVQRQQTKWVVVGVAVVLAVLALFAVGWLVPALVPGFIDRPTSLAVVALGEAVRFITFLIPLSFAVAILRYRLWDVDVIIRRTLVYGALTAALAGLYWLGVAGLQWVAGRLTGRAESTLAVVASTLAIAALAQPLRRRIQAAIDRRFYRQKYDAQRTLAAFAVSLRDETDLGRIQADLLGVVQETMQPAHASLWLRPVEGRRATRGQPAPDEAR